MLPDVEKLINDMSALSKEKGMARVSFVTQAYREFPKPIFSAWLHYRNNSAALLDPELNTRPCEHRRVATLDAAAALFAIFN